MKKSLFFYVLAVAAILSAPLAAHAASTSFFGPVVSAACNCPGAAPAWGCILQTFQNVINLLVSLTVVILTVFLAMAGFTYMTSGGSAEKRSLANQRIMNVVVGLLIVLCAWLLVDSLMKVIYNQNSSFGPWNAILASNATEDCLVAHALPNGLPALNSPANTTGGTATAPPAAAPAAGGTAIESNICNAANAYKGTSTASGPSGGSLACAWSVNNVLANAGISAIGGNAVSGMESALQGGRGTSVSQGSAVCGDIVIQAGDGHVGICLNSGCTQVISNSSSHATFTWISGPDFAPSYTGGVGRFYRVNN